MSRRVLLVEDDAAIRDTMREILEEEGYEVATAATLEEARTELARTRPALILLDYMLSDETAEPLLAELDPATRPPIVLMSASSMSPAVAKKHALILLPKPFELDAALALVAAAIAPRPR